MERLMNKVKKGPSKGEENQHLIQTKVEELPVLKTGILRFVFVPWLTSLIWYLFRHCDKPLTKDDLWECSENETVDANIERMNILWKKELEGKSKNKLSFTRVWFRFFAPFMVKLYIVACINAVVTFFTSAYAMELIITYLESDETSYVYVIAVVIGTTIGQVLRCASFAFLLLYGAVAGTRSKAAILGLCYEKLLKLKYPNGKLLAEMVTIGGGDVYRVHFTCMTITLFAALPIYSLIGVVYASYLIGIWSLVAVAVFTVCYVLQIWLSGVLAGIRQKIVTVTDVRINKMAEVINCMKLIKMYVWEKPFKKQLTDLRRRERIYLIYFAFVNSICASFVIMTPTIASVLTITCYRAAGNTISASLAFSVVASFAFLSVILGFIPISCRNLGEVLVSFERIKNFLNQEEYETPNSQCHNNSSSVEMIDAVFSWEADNSEKDNMNEKTTIHDGYNLCELQTSVQANNFTIRQGKFVGICGPVGCGKSSFIHAMMGRMPIVSGHLAVSGSVAYVSQQAWIFNGTVRENILFGKTFHYKWYNKVINVCALERDIALMPNGDSTEIGEKGMNISGGQKQRLSLARAVYSKSDIYLLDDPLSAVDVHVAKHLFHKCIKNTLKNKTVVLVTHQLQYLHYCDEILVMKDGRIVESGSHEYLMSKGGYYNIMRDSFHSSATTDEVFSDSEEKVNQEDQKTKKNLNGQTEPSLQMTDKIAGNIIVPEESELGPISFAAYKAYMMAAGGLCVCTLVSVCYTCSVGAITFSNWWLGVWLSSMEVEQRNSSSLSLQGFDNTTVPYPSNTTNVSAIIHVHEESIWDVYLIVYTASLGAIFLLAAVKAIGGSFATVNASNGMHNKALDRIFKATMYFFESNPSGRILNRFSRDVDESDAWIPLLTDILLQNMNVVILSFIVVGLTLPLVCYAIIPVVIVFGIIKVIVSASIREFKRYENISRSPLISHVNTSMVGLATLVTYKQQADFQNRFWEITDTNNTAALIYECCIRWVSLRIDILTSIVTIATSLVILLLKGDIDPAIAGMALNLSMGTILVIQTLVRMMNDVEGKYTSVERIHQYGKNIDSEESSFTQTPTANWPKDGHIFFSNVELSYRNSQQRVLRGISFDVNPGERIGIVGRTGAGKSSLAVALFRLVELSGGHIYIDGVDISQISLTLLRSKLSIIPQDPVLFAGTLRYNLDPIGSFGDIEIWRALNQAHMTHKVQQLSGMLDYEVEENGDNFSVGEKQLFCLARNILRRNKILILDEATASIDTATDDMIQQTIQESFAGCTVLTIAHRLNTVMHCDRVFVMDAGQVLEKGKPKDLLEDPNSFFNAMASSKSDKHSALQT